MGASVIFAVVAAAGLAVRSTAALAVEAAVGLAMGAAAGFFSLTVDRQTDGRLMDGQTNG